MGDVMPLERDSMEDLLPDMEFNDEEEGEALRPVALRDPGAPSATERERHNITDMHFRAWCSACVAGRARDRPHHHGSAPETRSVPEIVIDYAFMGSSDEDENLAILVMKDRRTRQEEVKRRSEGTAICENGPAGDSRANGVAEKMSKL